MAPEITSNSVRISSRMDSNGSHGLKGRSAMPVKQNQVSIYCGICIDLAVDPYTLGCSHQWCRGCLVDLISSGASLICPHPPCTRKISESEMGWLEALSLDEKHGSIQDSVKDDANIKVTVMPIHESDSLSVNLVIEAQDEKLNDNKAKEKTFEARGEEFHKRSAATLPKDQDSTTPAATNGNEDKAPSSGTEPTLKRKDNEISTSSLPKRYRHTKEQNSKHYFDESKENILLAPKMGNKQAVPYKIDYSLNPQLSGNCNSQIKDAAVNIKQTVKNERDLKYVPLKPNRREPPKKLGFKEIIKMSSKERENAMNAFSKIKIQQRIDNQDRFKIPAWLLNYWKQKKCHYCDKKFKLISALDQHQATAGHGAPHCCGLTFVDTIELAKHTETQEHLDYQAKYGEH